MQQPNEQAETLSQVLDRLEGLRAAMRTPGPYECDPTKEALFTWIRVKGGTPFLAGTSGRLWITDAASVVADLNAAPGLLALVRAYAQRDVTHKAIQESDELGTADEIIAAYRSAMSQYHAACATLDAALTAFLEGSR